MDVIKRLNDLRIERKISVYRLAELSGLNQSTLANTFSRGTVPSIVNLEAMCLAMGVTLAQFFNEGERTETLTADEVDIITEYRKLSASAQKALKELLKEYNK